MRGSRELKGCFFVVFIFIFFVFIIITGIMDMFSIINPFKMQNQVIYEVISPDNKYKAVFFERNTGATDAYSYHLSIIGVNDDIDNEIGNICISKDKISCTWLDMSNLKVLTSDKQLFKKLTTYKNIIISYE